MASCHGAAGHESAILRAQPAGMIDGRPAGGYTGRYEVICRACGDDRCLAYDEVPPGLQKLRGPSESLASGLAALHAHLGPLDEGPCARP